MQDNQHLEHSRQGHVGISTPQPLWMASPLAGCAHFAVVVSVNKDMILVCVSFEAVPLLDLIPCIVIVYVRLQPFHGSA